MESTLFYRGELRANGGPAHKLELRRHFHRQLKDLWAHLPLTVFYERLVARPREDDLSLLRARHGFTFVPLVTESVALV